MPKYLEKVDKILDKTELYVIGTSTIIFALIMFTNVVLRNIFHSGFTWTNEVSSYLNILGVYFAISAGFKFGDHVGVTAFVDFCIPKKFRKYIDLLTNVLCIVFCGFCAYFAFDLVMNTIQTGQTSAVLKVPIWLIYGIMMVGMIGSIVRLIMRIVKIFYKNTEGGNVTC